MSRTANDQEFRHDCPSTGPQPHIHMESPSVQGLRDHLRGVLQNSTHREIRNASCEIQDGAVVLHGRVSSFYLKQLAQALVASVQQVKQIRNELTVVYADSNRLLKQR